MSSALITALELIVAFFACAGVIYVFKDLWYIIGPKKMKTRAILYVSLNNDEHEAIETLMHISSFFNNSNARVYVSKIVATSVPEILFDEEENIKNALCIPLVFSKK